MRISALLDLAQAADPSSPPAGRQILYAKSDGHIYSKKSDGTVFQVDGGGVTGATTTVIDGGATPSEAYSGLTANAGIMPTIVDAKGDLIVATANDTVARLPIGTNGQTAIVDTTQSTGLKYVAVCEPYIMSVTGAVTVATGKSKIVLQAAYAVESIHAYVNTAPTGASLIVDVQKNGTTLFTTQGNRPTIAAGSNSSTNTMPDVTTFAANDILSVNVDQIGSTVAGSDLTVVIRLRRV